MAYTLQVIAVARGHVMSLIDAKRHDVRVVDA